MHEISADVVVAGGGVAGLMAALRARAEGARVVLVGGTPGASNRISSLNAALHDGPEDDPAALFNDIVVAGRFINNVEMVAAIARRIGPEIRDLSILGVPFHRDSNTLARRRAAGSTWTRAVFTLGMVGVDISRCVLERLRGAADPPVVFLDHAWLLDLQVGGGIIRGALAYLPREQRWVRISAPAVILATGGAGHLFGFTTNPPGSVGAGYALALEAGASLVDMEFISFEPFIMAAPSSVRGRDLPTTVLTEGARLRNGRGDEFFDTRTAPTKDELCRAMVREVREGRGTPANAVYYDLRGMSPDVVARYVQINQVLDALHLSAREARLEVMPAQHYVDGGVRTDAHGATDVPGLYAVGETAGGAHGAHRLAACGGTEAVAMGSTAGETAAVHARGHPVSPHGSESLPRPELLSTGLDVRDRSRLTGIRAALDDGCGIVRDEAGLRRAITSLSAIRDELEAEGRLHTFIGRALLVALSIARSANARLESRGDHYRTDHAHRDDVAWLGNVLVRRTRDGADVALGYQQASLAGRVRQPLPGRTPDVSRSAPGENMPSSAP